MNMKNKSDIFKYFAQILKRTPYVMPALAIEQIQL